MGYSETTSEHLAGFNKSVDYRLEVRGDPEQEWQALACSDFTLTQDSGGNSGAPAPATLRLEVPNDGFQYSDEGNAENPLRLLSQVRFSCSVNGESEVLFYGRVYRIEPRDCSLSVLCQDPLARLGECECEVSLAPDETDEITPAREVLLTGDGAFGSVYGFEYGGGGDAAFNADSDPGTRRRSWAPGDIRLWYDSGASEEVPPQHYSVNLTSGTVTLLEDTTGRSYFASGVRCYIEGTADWSEVFSALLQYPAELGGLGAESGELDLPALGLDLAGPLYFRGRAGELAAQVLQAQQANLRLSYDSRAAELGEPGTPGKFKLRLVEQLAADAADWTLQHARSIAQPRDLRELYSRVVVSGRSERPRNALTESGVSISDITTAGTWFSWDGLNVGGDSDFASAAPLLYDGDANKGASVHGLSGSEGGGSGRYDSWYSCIEIDLGALRRISRLRLVLPGSRNSNAAAGHQGKFWPGVQLQASVDGADWRLLSALLYGRFPPHSVVEARGKEILYPQARYVRVLLGAYKHGFDNEDDPSIGLAELEVYVDEEYRVVKEIGGVAEPASFYEYSADYDRDGVVDRWQRNQPGLWQRLGQRHRTRFEDQSGRLNEVLAHDYALDLLAESVRLFQQLSYQAVCDPRVRLYDTVAFSDELSGVAGSVLVERVVLNREGCTIYGTDYRAEPVG